LRGRAGTPGRAERHVCTGQDLAETNDLLDGT
jgi:hypothetical protein